MDATTKQMIEDLDCVIKVAKGATKDIYDSRATETVRSATFTKATIIEMMSKLDDKDKLPGEGDIENDEP